jgi:L-alanine-DL-glutamate epimerase-like enolase superfamily enzyme
LWGFHQSDYDTASHSNHTTSCPPTCFTIGLDEPEIMADKLRTKPGWPVYKIKLDQTGSIDIIRRLRQETDAVFRVDANCAWQANQVLELAEQLSELNVELIEQPLEADQYQAMRELKGRSAIPLMADESCQVEADIDKCLDSFDAINVKLVKCGGITPARRMLTRASQRGLKVMVGCMTESSIGIAAGAHLLPLLDYADLDGAMLLSEDIAEGLTWQNGYCAPPSGSGLGVRLKLPRST